MIRLSVNAHSYVISQFYDCRFCTIVFAKTSLHYVKETAHLKVTRYLIMCQFFQYLSESKAVLLV